MNIAYFGRVSNFDGLKNKKNPKIRQKPRDEREIYGKINYRYIGYGYVWGFSRENLNRLIGMKIYSPVESWMVIQLI